MTDEKFSPEESLQLIQSMISKAKQDMSGNSIYFLVWGWITFIGCIGQYVLMSIVKYEQHYHVWWLVVPGVVFTIWYSAKEGKQAKTKTYVGESMKYLWMGMGISFFVLSMILTRIGWDKPVFPFFILLYGLGTFISGNFLRFRPLIVGGIIAWVLAIGAVFTSYEHQMLFGAAAILFSYIIPAYMLRQRNRTANI